MTISPDSHREHALEHAFKAEEILEQTAASVFDKDAGSKAITHALLAIFHDRRAHHINEEEN